MAGMNDKENERVIVLFLFYQHYTPGFDPYTKRWCSGSQTILGNTTPNCMWFMIVLPTLLNLDLQTQVQNGFKVRSCG